MAIPPPDLNYSNSETASASSSLTSQNLAGGIFIGGNPNVSATPFYMSIEFWVFMIVVAAVGFFVLKRGR